MRVRSVVTVALAVGLLTGCGGDEGAGEGPVDSVAPSTGAPPAKTEAEWKASPGQLDKVTAVLTARRFACSDLDGDGFSWRVCAGPGREADSRERVKLVAAEDGTVVRFALDDSRSLLAVVGPVLVGPTDAAILQADGTNVRWGTVGEQEVDGFKDALTGSIAGLRRSPAPPAGPLPVTKEQVLVALTKTPSLRCRIDDGMSTPEPKELGQVDVGPTLHCRDQSLEVGSRRAVGVELADSGDGIRDLELTGAHESKAGLPALLTSRLAPAWAALGADLDDVCRAVDTYLRAAVDTTGYAAGWKILVDYDTVASQRNPTVTTGHSVSVRILRERPDLADPRDLG